MTANPERGADHVPVLVEHVVLLLVALEVGLPVVMEQERTLSRFAEPA
jgi:hypothetical protein